jgi:hypothetical protein
MCPVISIGIFVYKRLETEIAEWVQDGGLMLLSIVSLVLQTFLIFTQKNDYLYWYLKIY